MGSKKIKLVEKKKKIQMEEMKDKVRSLNRPGLWNTPIAPLRRGKIYHCIECPGYATKLLVKLTISFIFIFFILCSDDTLGSGLFLCLCSKKKKFFNCKNISNNILKIFFFFFFEDCTIQTFVSTLSRER